MPHHKEPVGAVILAHDLTGRQGGRVVTIYSILLCLLKQQHTNFWQVSSAFWRTLWKSLSAMSSHPHELTNSSDASFMA